MRDSILYDVIEEKIKDLKRKENTLSNREEIRRLQDQLPSNDNDGEDTKWSGDDTGWGFQR